MGEFKFDYHLQTPGKSDHWRDVRNAAGAETAVWALPVLKPRRSESAGTYCSAVLPSFRNSGGSAAEQLQRSNGDFAGGDFKNNQPLFVPAAAPVPAENWKL